MSILHPTTPFRLISALLTNAPTAYIAPTVSLFDGYRRGTVVGFPEDTSASGTLVGHLGLRLLGVVGRAVRAAPSSYFTGETLP